jgi:hypothetical protein
MGTDYTEQGSQGDTSHDSVEPPLTPEELEYDARWSEFLALSPETPNSFERAAEADKLLFDPLCADRGELSAWAGATEALVRFYEQHRAKALDVPFPPYPEPHLLRAANPLQYLAECVDKGYFPPPGVLWVVMECIERYYKAEGQLSLDEAFFGAPHKKSSSHANKQSKDRVLYEFESHVSREKRFARVRGEPDPSLTSLAESYLAGDSTWGGYSAMAPEERPSEVPDLETFLRRYRRWKSAQGEGC